MTIILAIALIVGGGTSFAAQSSLPGDVLYSVKVNVNEEVQNFITFGSEAKAKFSAKLAERRLEEAGELASSGKLNATTRADLEARFENHVKNFENDSKTISSEGKVSALLEINSDFEAALKANEQVLAGVVSQKSEVRSDVESILTKVRAGLDLTLKNRAEAEAKMSVEAGSVTQTAAEGKLKAAENKIAEVKDFVAKTKSSVSANVSAEAEAKIKIAEEAIAKGKAKMEAQVYGGAFTSFTEAMRISQEAKLIVSTGAKINFDIVPPGLNIRIDNGSSSENEDDDSLQIDADLKVKSGSASSAIKSDSDLKVKVGL